MKFSKGNKIGNYKVVFPYKQSAYAETYRVKDVSGNNLFLKLIDRSKLHRSQVDAEGRILEIEILEHLNHSNLCRLIDIGTIISDGKNLEFFVTEFVSGEILSEYLSRGDQLSIYEIKEITKTVLSTLDYIHSQPVPIIHNEVNIQNVMLNFEGGFHDLKLIGFGQARYLNQQIGKPNMSSNNPFYMAPERFSGVCSVQTDLYSVGAMIYFLIYKKLPWFIDLSKVSGTDAIDAIILNREKDLELPKIKLFELDDQLVNTIVKALSQDSEDRFQSAKEFISAIDGKIKVESQSKKRKLLYSQSGNINQYSQKAKRGLGFSAVAGMDELKRQLQEEVIAPLQYPDEYRRYGITIPNGMLLYGPPGCGKTFFAKHFAEEVGFNFMFMTPSSLKSRYVNATQENIANMFKEAEENAPTIIFIDEINELLPNREGDVHEMSKSAVNEMLAQMDRTGEKGIFIIGATNNPQMIDPAVLRAGRFDKKYYVGVPDFVARKALFELFLKDRPYDFGIDYGELSMMTDNYISADIHLIVNVAARNALQCKSKITMELLREAIYQTKPSLSKIELQRYEKIRAELCGDSSTQYKRNKRVGFIK